MQLCRILGLLCASLLGAGSATAQRPVAAADSLPLTSAMLRAVICHGFQRCGAAVHPGQVPLYGLTPIGIDFREGIELSRIAGSWDAAVSALGRHAPAPFDTLVAAGLLSGICPERAARDCGYRGEVAAVLVGVPVRTGPRTVALYAETAGYWTDGATTCGGSAQEYTLQLRAVGAEWQVLRSDLGLVADMVACPERGDPPTPRR